MRQILSSNLNPIDVLNKLNFPMPQTLPDGMAVGTFELKGVFTFNAAADTTICDIRDPANWQADATDRVSALKQSNPQAILAVHAIEVVWIDQHVLEHADPEDIARVWEGIELVHSRNNSTTTWPLRDACRVAAQPAGIIDSDQLLEVRAYRYRTTALFQPPEGTLLFDLYQPDTLVVQANAAASASLLTANADVRIRLHGAVWSRGNGEIGHGTNCTANESLAVLQEASQRQDAQRAKLMLSMNRF